MLVLLVLYSIFFFVLIIALPITSSKAPNSAVWSSFINGGGWSNNGVSFCIGFLTPAFALAGSDAVVHMSEETRNARVNIPRAMIGSSIINGLSGFGFIIAVLYSITDVDAVLATNTGFPIIEVFHQATNNVHAATAMMCTVIIIFFMGGFGILASTSRLTWAFARDR